MNKLIMLVDDSSVDIYINTKLIEQSQIAQEILVMESGKEALNYINRNINIVERLPDVLFLDLNMPGIDGFNFLKEFKELGTHIKNKIKIVVLTSSDKTEDIHFIINNQLVKRYFIKPLSEETLDEVKRMLK